MTAIKNQIMDIIKQKSIFCIDCFDTILFRTCEPEQVIAEWLEQICVQFGVRETELKLVWKASLNAVNRKRTIEDECSFRVLSMEFYHRIFYLKVIPYSFDEFYQYCLDTMLAVEMGVIVVNPDILEILEFAKENGKRVYCVSDFYLPKSAIETLFHEVGILNYFSGIYISSSVGKRKSTGKLYDYIIDDEHCQENDMVMIGDNRKSDYLIPKRKNISAVWYREKLSYKKEIKEWFENFYALYKENVNDELPFVNYVFSIYVFCKKLHLELLKDGHHTVYFFSREGQFLKKIFDQFLQTSGENAIETKYMYVSRQSTYLPSLSMLKDEKFELLQKQFTTLSLSDFLKSINIFESVCSFTNLKEKYDFEQKEEAFFDSNKFKEFCEEKDFAHIYEQERKKARKEIGCYLESIGINRSKDSIAIVDIGWKGSIQDNIYKIFDHQINIVGYYYGITGNVDISENNIKKGLVFSDIPYESKDYGIYKINYRMLERVLYASHGSCIGYKDSHPLLDEVSREEAELYKFVSQVQEKMLLQCEKISNYIKNNKIGDNKIDYVMATIHGVFCMDVSRIRLNQMKYMDARQKMNFGDWGNCSGRKLYRYVKQIVTMNKIELVQKLLMMLGRIHLQSIGLLLRKTCIWIYIKRRCNG